MTYSIRRLGVDDLVAYRAIRMEALVNHPEAFLTSAEGFAQRSDDEVRKMLEDVAVFGAETADGALVGLNALFRNEGLKERHRGWMVQVYVKPEHRGTGLSKALCEHLIEYARHHVLQVHLGVWAENVPAIKLYEKLGFSIYGTEPRYLFVNGRFVDEHMMVRFLDEAPIESDKK